MRKIIAILVMCLSMTVMPMDCFGQFGFGMMNINRDSLNRLTAADYADMVKKLGVKEIRPGRDPNTNDESRQPNYNEMIANPYPFYPEALVSFDGKDVIDAQMWKDKRRPELVKVFEDEIYGRIPENVPAITWVVTKEEKRTVGNIPVVLRQLLGKMDNSACPSIKVEIQAQVVWPDNGKNNFPVVLEFTYMLGDPARAFGQGTPWQQQVLERGWAAAQIVPTSYHADGGHGLTTGVIGLCNKGKHRNPTDWGALRAWGWGASKMIDYFEKDALFDATKVAIEGVSRYGKASLVAMAFDERIAAGFICSSGKGGANGWRRDCGESVGNLAGEGEYHWMAGNFIKYSADNLTANDMKIDQHEFIALCAPRPCFISVGTWDADKWQDIMGMFMMTVKATPVYELLGKKGLDTNMLPQVDFGLLDGTLVYRQHHGGHEAGPNWPFFLDFFEREVVKR